MYIVIRARFSPRITRESYRYRETPQNPSAFYILNFHKPNPFYPFKQLITLSFENTSSLRIDNPLHCTTKYRLLLSDINSYLYDHSLHQRPRNRGQLKEKIIQGKINDRHKRLICPQGRPFHYYLDDRSSCSTWTKSLLTHSSWPFIQNGLVT